MKRISLTDLKKDKKSEIRSISMKMQRIGNKEVAHLIMELKDLGKNKEGYLNLSELSNFFKFIKY